MPAAVKSSGLRTQISSSWSGVGIGKNLMEEQCSQMVLLRWNLSVPGGREREM